MIEVASNAGIAYSNRKMPEILAGRGLRGLLQSDRPPMKHSHATAQRLFTRNQR
jgi:hypothetical protein